LFNFDSETISAALEAFVFLGRRRKKSSTFFEEKMHPSDLARGCSDLEMTWLLCCAGAATAQALLKGFQGQRSKVKGKMCDL